MKKCLPHVVGTAALMVFMVLGLGSASGNQPQVAQQGAAQAPAPQQAPATTPQQAAPLAIPAATPTSPFWSGNGGRGMTLAVLEPAGNGLSEDEMRWMPSLIQGSMTGDFNLYSAITIVDRQNLETILDQQGMSMSGYFSDEDFIRIGHIANARYVLAGTVTRTATAYMMEFAVTDVQTGVRRASRPPTQTSIREIENLSAVREATVDLLGQLGVTLTGRGRQELTRAPEAATVQAQTALARGIYAQRQGFEIEAMSHFMQAAGHDPLLEEVENRLVILTAGITARPPVGALDARADIVMRGEWMRRLQETENFVRDFLARDQPFYLIYYTDITHGTVNFQNETVELSFAMRTVPDSMWTHTVNEVVLTVESGLRATGRSGDWGFDWPNNTVGVASPFVGRSANAAVTMEILNDQGRVIGTGTAAIPRGFRVRYGMTIPSPEWSGTVVVPGVDINAITDRLSIRVAAIDGVPAGQAAAQRRISVMPAQSFALHQRVRPGGVVATNERYFTVNENGVLTGFTGTQTNVVIPSVVRGTWIVEIGASAFSGRVLNNVTIPNGVRSIGISAFFGNERLTSVTIPDSVRTIGSNAFFPQRGSAMRHHFIITNITIGAYVDLYHHGTGISFRGEGFDVFYRQNGRRAGTYTRSGPANNPTWNFTPR
ncbi:MAG: leucine-rich repeat domain-containing protein [Treponema sp.]|nr:leucine-rich repeat domain-containing protein [Treponema sp.]